jgi:hypothetical protein
MKLRHISGFYNSLLGNFFGKQGQDVFCVVRCWAAADGPMDCLAGNDVWRHAAIEGLCFLCMVGAEGL